MATEKMGVLAADTNAKKASPKFRWKDAKKMAEVNSYIAVENGKVGIYVEGTFATTKSATIASGADVSIVRFADGLANKADFDEGDYLPFYPDLGELKAFEDGGSIYWVYNDDEHRYYTMSPNKTFVLQGSNIEIVEGGEVVADVTTGKQFKAFKLED